MTHVMLDLETMGAGPEAAIVAIGAVRFDSQGVLRSNSFYRVVSLASAMRNGGKVEASTIYWWMQQGEEARKALCGDDSVLLEVALKEFNEWVRGGVGIMGMWGNGADFDNVILAGAYKRIGWTPPWSHTENRCYRTLRALFPGVVRGSVEERVGEAGGVGDGGGVAHRALDDAIAQAEHAVEILRIVEGRVE